MAFEEPLSPAIGTAADYEALVGVIAQAHDRAQQQAVQAVNMALTLRNWLIGYHIVEYQQHGRDRAQYGERLLERLSQDLRRDLGRGFGWRNLEVSNFAITDCEIGHSLAAPHISFGCPA
jgi:hypothetical protein